MDALGSAGRGILAALAATVFVAAAGALLAGSLTIGVSWFAVASGLVAGVLAFRAAASPEPKATRWQLVALVALAFASLRQFLWLLFERAGVVYSWNPFNYGDLPLHLTYIQFLANGAPFWPENPVFTGARLQYPFGMDLWNAVWLRLGVPLELGLEATGLIAAAALGVGLRRFGGALAVSAFLLSGGIATGALEWKSLYLALFVPQRGLLFALPAGLLLLSSWRDRLLRGGAGELPVWVEGLLFGVMPLFHLHTFLVLALTLAVWAGMTGRVRPALPPVLVAFVPATWGVFEVTNGLRAVSLLGWAPGWTMGDANPVVFLAKNFALFFPLALWAGFAALRRGTREERLLIGPALGLLAACFLVRLAPWAWDNTKVMLWAYLLAVPAIGATLGRWPAPVRVAAIALWLAPGGATLVAASFGSHDHRVFDRAERREVCRALLGTAVTARIATAQSFNHPVALCGHPLVVGYGGHLWSHGIASAEVESRLRALMRGGEGWEDEARTLGARYLFWGPREARQFFAGPRGWLSRRVIAEGEWGRLFDLGP